MNPAHSIANGWRIDKHIPLALIFAIIIQTGGALLWAGAVSARMSQLERAALTAQELGERVTRIEEQTKAVRESLARIEIKLDKVSP